MNKSTYDFIKYLQDNYDKNRADRKERLILSLENISFIGVSIANKRNEVPWTIHILITLKCGTNIEITDRDDLGKDIELYNIGNIDQLVIPGYIKTKTMGGVVTAIRFQFFNVYDIKYVTNVRGYTNNYFDGCYDVSFNNSGNSYYLQTSHVMDNRSETDMVLLLKHNIVVKGIGDMYE